MEVLPDERDIIASRLATLAGGNQISAIFTTGGTGIAARDVTPEATRAVLDREIPGDGRTDARARTKLDAAGGALARRGGNARAGADREPAGFAAGALSNRWMLSWNLVPTHSGVLEGKTDHAEASKPEGN